VDDKLQKARDQHFQDLHRKKIRQRASFILTPFKKRNESTSWSSAPGNGVTYDNAQPPPLPVKAKGERKVSEESKTSGSLKSKIRKVFRRNSTTPLVLPAQHVEASRAYYGDGLANQPERPLRQPQSVNALIRNPVGSTGNSRSTSPVRSMRTTESRSRVTSWADSTIAGTVNSRESKALAVIQEDLPQPAPSTRSRKFSSLGIFRRSRKSSAITLPETPPPPPERKPINDDPFQEPILQSGVNRASTVYDTLPSQARRISGNSSRGSFSLRPTIRPVPSDSGGNLSSRSCSSRLASTSTNHLIHHDEASSEEEENTLDFPGKRLRNRLHKARREEPAKPTTEQIAHRVEKSNERWKQPLETGRSIFFPHSSQGASSERHSRPPRQLESSPESEIHAPENVFEPTTQEPQYVSRTMGVISPSIYSQNTSSSPTRIPNGSAISLDNSNRHAVIVGTAVINPSQLAGKYSIGSSAQGIVPRLAKASRDWKAWLSKEVQELETQPIENFTLNGEYIQPPARSGHRREHAQIVDGEDVTIGTRVDHTKSSIPIPSIEPLLPQSRLQEPLRNMFEETTSSRQSSLAPSQPSSHPRFERPRLIDRPSSRMNERFPFIETGQPPSRASRRSSRKSTPPRSELPPPLVKKENPASSSMLAVPVPQPRRPLHRPMSTSSFHRSNSSLAQYTTNTSATASSSSISQINRSTSHIPRPSAASGSGTDTIKPAISNSSLHNRSTSALSSPRPAFAKAMTTPLTLAGPNVDTDSTLAAIFKGPYRENSASPALPRAISVRKVPSHSQMLRQQSSPHMARESSSTMPRESSSLRRAESSSILRDGQISLMLRATSSLSLKENHSPSRSAREGSSESTPTRGQILAERFLEARGYGGSSPASPRFI
jgi:hypothetical protein